MKKILLATLAVTALAGSALAADLPPRPAPVYKAPPPYVPVWTWTGFYVGGNVGGAWGRSEYDTNPNCPPITANSTFCNAPPSPFAPNGPAVAATGTGTLNPTGFTGGAQAGFNWQTGPVVFGVEADINALNLKRTVAIAGVFPVPFLGTQFVLTESLNTSWLATVRGRIGFTVTPSFLIYATGGVAFTNFGFSSTYNDNAIGGAFTGGVGAGSVSGTRTAGVVGGGAEWMFLGNWSVKAEYLYASFGTRSFLVPTANSVAGFNQTMFEEANLKVQIARVGLNYKFDWGYYPAPAIYK
jgi:outer membrane immunogenic protein